MRIPHAVPLILGLVMAMKSVEARGDEALTVHHREVRVGDVTVFYREAGSPDRPAVLLLHGFGASSHMFRNLIPKLARDYYVLAPDLPGFGFTEVRGDAGFQYTFDNLARVIDEFTWSKGLNAYAMYVFDYGAPVGWRLAVNNPEKITAIVSQNGNAYEEGLSAGWGDIREAWEQPTHENREKLRKFSTLAMTKWQYTEGVPHPGVIEPESYHLAHAAMDRLGHDIQVDLLLDYRTNLEQYARVQAYFRLHQPATLVVWGRNDPFFVPAGAEAFKRDNPHAEVHLIETGHFAIETHADEIASRMLDFLGRHVPR